MRLADGRLLAQRSLSRIFSQFVVSGMVKQNKILDLKLELQKTAPLPAWKQ